MNNNTINQHFYQFPLFPDQPKTKLYHPNSTQMPGRIRIGDIDKDGFEDLLITVLEEGDTLGTTYMFMNERCQDPNCTRKFGISTIKDMDKFKRKNSVSYSAFFDFGSMGFIDII